MHYDDDESSIDHARTKESIIWSYKLECVSYSVEPKLERLWR